MVRNPALGPVLAEVGLKLEGLLRQHERKNEVFEDLGARYLMRPQSHPKAC